MSIVKFGDFKLAWLHTFVCVAKLGGFSNAARHLGISQSTASRQVEALEKWFERNVLTNNIPPQLTKSGKNVYGMAETILFDLCNYNGTTITKSLRGEKYTDQECENLKVLQIFMKKDQ